MTTRSDDGVQGAPVRVDGVSKVFADGTEALREVDLAIDAGELVTLIGPSGCGKSTLLRAMADLTQPTAGSCEIDPAVRRAFVFQQPTLLPWRNAQRNAELLLGLEGYDKEERRQRARQAMELVGLAGFEKAYPRALSGGMKMRLSLARALALDPQLFMLDEPFSAIDEITREQLNDELIRIWARQGFTAVLVTHNLYEAVYVSQRVVVMSPRPGRITQEFAIPFDYPRTPDLRATPEYGEIVTDLSRALREANR